MFFFFESPLSDGARILQKTSSGSSVTVSFALSRSAWIALSKTDCTDEPESFLRFLFCSRGKVGIGLIALNGVSPTEGSELDCDVAVANDFLTITGDSGVSCVNAGEAGGVNKSGATFDWVLLIPITAVKKDSSLKKRHVDEEFPPAPDLAAFLRRVLPQFFPIFQYQFFYEKNKDKLGKVFSNFETR